MKKKVLFEFAVSEGRLVDVVEGFHWIWISEIWINLIKLFMKNLCCSFEHFLKIQILLLEIKVYSVFLYTYI